MLIIGAKRATLATRRKVSTWSPIENFPLGSELGLWYDPTSFDNLRQDIAGTALVTAADQPVCYVVDKLGRNKPIKAAAAFSRLLARSTAPFTYVEYDGVNTVASTSGIILGADMDMFILMRRWGASGILTYPVPGGATYLGALSDSTTAASTANCNNPTFLVNGVSLGNNVLQNQLKAALVVGQWVVLEIRNINMSTWTSFGMTSFSGKLRMDFGGLIVAPAGAEVLRTNNRKWLGAKAGLVL